MSKGSDTRAYNTRKFGINYDAINWDRKSVDDCSCRYIKMTTDGARCINCGCEPKSEDIHWVGGEQDGT